MRRNYTLLVTVVIYVITSVALLSYLKKIPIRMKFVETTPNNEFMGHFSIYRDATLPMVEYSYVSLANASSSCHNYRNDETNRITTRPGRRCSLPSSQRGTAKIGKTRYTPIHSVIGSRSKAMSGLSSSSTTAQTTSRSARAPTASCGPPP